MKRRTLRRSRREGSKMKGTVARQFPVQLGQVSLLPFQQPSSSSNPYRFQKLLEAERNEEEEQPKPSSLSLDVDADLDVDFSLDEKDFILSQDFFCTPDYITPDGQQISNSLDCNKENIPCPKSPEKLKTVRSKRQRQEGFLANSLSSSMLCNQVMDLESDSFDQDDLKTENPSVVASEKKMNYVSQSAVALRCRVLPPPCIRNPYIKEVGETDLDPLGSRRAKSTGFFSSVVGGDGLSRYHTDFHEIEQIGYGNFSRVFKVLKRIDGCMYAVKHSIRQLHQDTEKRQALMEVQALAALGSHANIVNYYTSWFENEHLYIQMELCDCSLSIKESSPFFSEGEVLEIMYQICTDCSGIAVHT
uniref:Protein kinase domain-containing protein n=1 Tax=Nelumbo nucifera TaxID=4432 RepID=A0A822YLG3_NELNU|nr:TPA_asm: hypothetical protein HUJ06_012223 [Nelumbo nucifera]